MAYTDSRMSGTLTLGGTNFEFQLEACSMQPTSREDSPAVTTIDETEIAATNTTDWVLAFTAIQDFTNSSGLTKYAFDNDQSEVAFVLVPNDGGAGSVQISGNVTVQALALGGSAKTRNTSEATWPVTGTPTWGVTT